MYKQEQSTRLNATQHIAELPEIDIEVCTMLANHFEVYLDEMFSMSRKKYCVYCRHLYARWQRKNTVRSLQKIGEKVRVLPIDHTTVLHSIETANALIKTDSHVRMIWDAIRVIKPFIVMPEYQPDPNWVKTKVDNRHLIAQC